ncbi:MAG: outer membrane beta-barrel domain-containing protein [Deltaproteobacteria bacterium]|nr:outer membrane beta-barrel domain-containing protein [Nannocystaceae bacterium]
MALAAIWALPVPSWAAVSVAQRSAAASELSAELSAELATGPAAPPEGDDDVVVVDDMEGEPTTPEKPAGDGTTPPAGDGGDVGDLLGGDEPTTPDPAVAGETGKQEKDSEEKQIKAEIGQISVIQRQRMLKKKRFELMPQFGISVNDPYVRHYTLGLDLNYWFHNRMAVGITGTGLIGAKTPRYNNIRFQEGLLLTANKVLWQASLNFTYNPFYGKIAIFNRALLHWEGSVTIGGGATQTQVLPRYEAIHEPFRTVTGGGQFGLNGRFYTRRIDWLSVNAGVRTWIYADKQEPINRGPDDGLGGIDDPRLNDAGAAKDAADFKVAYNVVFYLGVSFYFPTTFEYKTPR